MKNEGKKVLLYISGKIPVKGKDRKVRFLEYDMGGRKIQKVKNNNKNWVIRSSIDKKTQVTLNESKIYCKSFKIYRKNIYEHRNEI